MDTLSAAKRENRRPDAVLVFFLKRKKEPLADMKVPEDNVKKRQRFPAFEGYEKASVCFLAHTGTHVH